MKDLNSEMHNLKNTAKRSVVHKIRSGILCLSCCLLLTPFSIMSAQTSKGTDFWLAFMENINLNMNGPPTFSLLVSAPSNATGTVTAVATGFSFSFSVSAGKPAEILFPSGIYYPQGSEAVTNMGFNIVSDNPVSISVQHYRAYFSDASSVLPSSELGNSYMVMAHADDSKNGASEFIVVATENNSVIDITPSANTFLLKPAGVSFSVTLNKGQTYQVQSKEDLSGSLVSERSGKKLAVFSGALSANIGKGCSADNTLYDQDNPISAWGKEYIVVPFSKQGGDPLRILASENNTIIQFNCSATHLLNKGQYFDTIVSMSMRITSTLPVSVGQFNKGQNCNASGVGDPSFLILKPVSVYSRECLFRTINTGHFTGSYFSNHYLNIVARTADKNNVLLDNVSLKSHFFPLPSSPIYSYAQITLDTGIHILQCDSGFYAYMYGFGYYDAYTYFLSYDGIRSPAGNVTVLASGSFCKDSLQFNAISEFSPSGWSWNFGDGSGSTQPSPSHIYQVPPGTYMASVTLQGPDGCIYGGETPVHLGDCSDCEIFVPDLFSPNNDGQNDFLCVYTQCFEKMDFSIYDRWGEQVFHSNDKSICWDGTYKGKLMNSAVFVYSLKATLFTGQTVTRHGNVTLLR
ncbi:MAG TPA: gliding motility-associated C-terminal domain-containing protein [Bacteroidia bacterium]|nr:gliding motility-associated C-terminal domain-containing protein [Bacteroidia bacterium]